MPRKSPLSYEVETTDLRAGANSRALAKTLKTLDGLTDAHAALVQHAKTLALLVDCVPSEGTFHREYREALRELGRLAADAPDAFQQLMSEINAS